MKFSCSREHLDKALQNISRVITVRNSLPVLSNVLIETDDKIVRLSGTDLELAMTTYFPASVEQEGTFTVPAKIFQEFVHQNPDDTLGFTLQSFDLLCKSGKVQARIAGMEAEEFPALPKVEQGVKLTLSFVHFAEALKRVAFACAADQSRPVLTAVLAVFDGESLIVAATDSFRLAEKKIRIIPTQETLSMLLPSRTVQELIRLGAAAAEKDDIEIEVTSQQALFRIGEMELYSRLVNGSFPKYQAIIPSAFKATADVTTAEFVQALRLSAVFSQAGIANVLLEVNDKGELILSSYGSQRGSTTNTIYALLQEGYEPLKVAFNAKFLLDACTALPSTHLQLRFSGPTTPLVVASEEKDYLQLVMPIRLDS